MKTALHLPNKKDFILLDTIEVLKNNFNEEPYGLDNLESYSHAPRPPFKKNALTYKKCLVNMRSILDVIQNKISIDVIDETKYDAYVAELKEIQTKWEEENSKRKPNFVSSSYIRPYKLNPHAPINPIPANVMEAPTHVPPTDAPLTMATEYSPEDFLAQPNVAFNLNLLPKCPTIKIEIDATMIVYYNGLFRILAMPLEEFQEIYFNYLTSEKLDMND